MTRLNWKEETGGREAGEAILIIAYTEVTRAQSRQAGDEAGAGGQEQPILKAAWGGPTGD